MHIGIDLGGTKCLLLAEMPNGTVVERADTGSLTTANDVRETIARFTSRFAAPESIGIAIPGLVDEQGTVVACDVLPNIVGWSPAEIFGARNSVAVLNDAEAALIAESQFWAHDATGAVIVAGTGIGAAFQVNGRILRGSAGFAGELGSIPAGTAILDNYASGAAILERAAMSAPALAAAAERNDEAALRTIAAAGAWLGYGVATVIDLFNPAHLVLAGGTLRWPGYFDAALRSARERSLAESWRSCTIEVSRFGELLVATGAARAARTCA
ncbi:MAG: ROK family protein [Vulcanimicrobiaceae bacterium]